MNIRLLVIFFSFIAYYVSGQLAVPTPTQTYPLHVGGYVTNLKGNGMPGVTVVVNQGGKILNTVTTDGSGKYDFDLPLNFDYSIVVSKPGMATKKYSATPPILNVECCCKETFCSNPGNSFFNASNIIFGAR